MKQLLISDANILIDMEEGHLIEEMFQLPYQFSIPDILFVEELEAQHQYLLGCGLIKSELSGETMMDAVRLIERYRKASRNDCFALALAAQEQCPLLTGDQALRNAAQKESVDVKGTLWLVQAMIEYELITTQDARQAYEKMRSSGRRLPWDLAFSTLGDF